MNVTSCINDALEQVKKVLDTTRTPLCFGDVHHTYADKYSLTEFLARVALSAESTCLQVLGLTDAHLSAEYKRTVSLRFRAAETASFVREEKRTVESPSIVHTTVSDTKGP
jgi:hypothetical protein